MPNRSCERLAVATPGKRKCASSFLKILRWVFIIFLIQLLYTNNPITPILVAWIHQYCAVWVEFLYVVSLKSWINMSSYCSYDDKQRHCIFNLLDLKLIHTCTNAPPPPHTHTQNIATSHIFLSTADQVEGETGSVLSVHLWHRKDTRLSAMSWNSALVWTALTSALMSLNLVMKACLTTSTAISEAITMATSGNSTHRWSERTTTAAWVSDIWSFTFRMIFFFSFHT